MSSDLAIQVSNISKTYVIFDKPEDRLKQMVMPQFNRAFGRPERQYCREFSAVKNVSFEVGRGETVGIVGRNGSGKSTILQMICGTLNPTSGSVAVSGRVAALLELGAGFNPDFSGRENVFLNAAILGLSHEETASRFDQILQFADIGNFIDQPVKTFSSGMFVRLAFAVATSVDPDILIVDEALAVGDEAFQRKCYARIDEIKSRGCTILFVSHGAQTVIQLCDRAILLDRGEKILEGSPRIVINQYQRMLNLSGDAAEVVREKIKGMDGWLEPDLPLPEHTTIREEDQESAEDEAWFDPGLVSQSRVEYEMKGARIDNVRILDHAGRHVNNLVMGRSYRLAYDVTFSADAEFVAFAMFIKTVQGAELAGQSSSPAGQGFSFASGDIVEVALPFLCSFLPGTYFSNCGVYINGAGQFVQLHRILDAIAFRVAPVDPDYVRMGVVDLRPNSDPIQIHTRKTMAG